MGQDEDHVRSKCSRSGSHGLRIFPHASEPQTSPRLLEVLGRSDLVASAGSARSSNRVDRCVVITPRAQDDENSGQPRVAAMLCVLETEHKSLEDLSKSGSIRTVEIADSIVIASDETGSIMSRACLSCRMV